MMRSILATCLVLFGCSDPAASGGGDDDGIVPDASGSNGDMIDAAVAEPISVIIIPFENKDDVDVYNNMTDAPYINGLMTTTAAYATMFKDELAQGVPSEPHYVWMEAGTNVFTDKTFTSDSDASMSNSTASTEHLSTQLDAAGISWKSYQEDAPAGKCPISSSSIISSGQYAAKHDPFVFFQDVAGSPPSESNTRCAEHHGTFADLASDLMADKLPRYSFITPNLCHDMHGAITCSSGISNSANVKAGDTWLSTNLPPLIAYAHEHNAVIMLVWDEGNANNLMPFVMIGDHVKPGPNATLYNHSSQLATVERMLGVPKLAKVADAADFEGMFEPGYLP
jgi:hypothetical protein